MPGDITAVLRQLLIERGDALLSDPTLLRNLLADLAPAQRLERNLLATAAQQGIPARCQRA